ncbi:MAG: hypothetical protein IJA02_07330 [Clostridia bacterium]|nr:hypothetical protein [Clostridia bacterium]
MTFLKQIFAVILSFLQMLVMNVSYGEYVKPEAPQKQETELVNDISGDTTLADSIKYASSVASEVDAYYTDGERTAFALENTQMVFTHTLGNINGATLADKDGNSYISQFDTFYTKGGLNHYFSSSESEGRVNVIRLGEYYYECHIRDYGAAENEFKIDKTYHVYADRLYTQYSLLASEASTALEAFGSEIMIDANTVKAVEVKDKNGVHDNLNIIDYASVEYAAFDIDGVGVVGFIVPADGSTKEMKVEQYGDTYYVTQYANYTAGTGINKYDETGGYDLNSVTFGCRIYSDATHSFAGISKAAELERNPLEGITVAAGNSNAAYLGYDALNGAYTLRMDGTDFNTAYANPTLHFTAPISITCDDNDRDIYIRARGNNGCLEAGAILDDTNTLVPINVQVCKNFQGDGGEPFYSVKDYQYGDSFFPVSLKANETLNFTLLNLYQNWGNNPLKQLSSIEFHVSYYHLSTGVTETNCIAPYFVYGKDGWTLPDFRNRSGNMWASQPQFNSVCTLEFMTYDKRILGIRSEEVLSEYKGCEIDSTGLLYSDITNDYESDCDAYTYSVRHVEFPQTDENRTYYTLDVKFNREITFADFKRDFSLFYADGRYINFNKFGYLDAENNPASADANPLTRQYYTLGDECPYWGFYNTTECTNPDLEAVFGCNFAMVIKDSKIVVGGEEQDIAFVARLNPNEETTSGSLTLDAKKITFMPGDSITIDMILLPWGTGDEDHNDNVLYVREDSAIKPMTLTAHTGEVVEDAFIPTFRAEDGVAEFTVSGGRNNTAIKIMGFTKLECPKVYVVNGESRELVNFASENGYDGYQVQYEDDGTYSFTFLDAPASPDDTVKVYIEQ